MPLPIYSTNSTQSAPLGSEYMVGMDRVFRYAKNGSGALAVGTVLQAASPNDSHRNMTCAVAPVGQAYITVTLAYGDPMVANEYKEGYIYINDQAGEGYLYEVKDHLGGDAGEDSTKRINLRNHVAYALTTSSQATLVKNPFADLLKPLGNPWEIVVGVTPVAVPANEYFWLQVRGPAVVLQAGNLWAGRGVMPSSWKPGAVETLKQVIPIRRDGGQELLASTSHSTEAFQFQQEGVEMGATLGEDYLTETAGKATIPIRPIGYCINPRVSTEHALVYLTLS
jgi:hypothetical protein